MSTPNDASRRAIVDVGSNSVRLVIYDGPARIPFVVHNEKVQARLGRGLAATGRIDPEAYALTIAGCRRFRALLNVTGVTNVRMVATAAARDAANGPDLLEDLRKIGFVPELLSGDAEASGSASGVLSAFPDANGIVGDLGGGSLELIEINDRTPGRRATFPLGLLRLAALRENGDEGFRDAVSGMLQSAGWAGTAADRPFYLVGGSWRAIGHLDMHLLNSKHPGVHGYAFDPGRIKPIREAIAELGSRLAKTVPGISASRAPGLDDAALLLAEVSARLGCGRSIVSTFGLREGLLFAALDPDSQGKDPLLTAVAAYAFRNSNPTWNGDLVADWIAPVFAGEGAADCRLRRAVCHLAGVDLHAQSETRARHGMELAWLGSWIGLNAGERAMLAQAMWTAWSGKGLCAKVGDWASPEALRLAVSWGEAIRLAERFGGGMTSALAHVEIGWAGSGLSLSIDRKVESLGGTVVAKQLAALAQSLGTSAAIHAR